MWMLKPKHFYVASPINKPSILIVAVIMGLFASKPSCPPNQWSYVVSPYPESTMCTQLSSPYPVPSPYAVVSPYPVSSPSFVGCPYGPPISEATTQYALLVCQNNTGYYVFYNTSQFNYIILNTVANAETTTLTFTLYDVADGAVDVSPVLPIFSVSYPVTVQTCSTLYFLMANATSSGTPTLTLSSTASPATVWYLSFFASVPNVCTLSTNVNGQLWFVTQPSPLNSMIVGQALTLSATAPSSATSAVTNFYMNQPFCASIRQTFLGSGSPLPFST